MELRFLISARNDLAHLRDHYRLTLPANCRDGQHHLRETLALLRRDPEVGMPLPSPPGLRAVPVPLLPFVLIYRATGRRVDVLRLMRLDHRESP
jgi:plasmid stabilization system protein ParE